MAGAGRFSDASLTSEVLAVGAPVLDRPEGGPAGMGSRR
jgi:hypothetical protein